MRGRIALRKHFVRNSRETCFVSRKLWECGASSRRFSRTRRGSGFDRTEAFVCLGYNLIDHGLHVLCAFPHH
jgi:hypothetical protein